MTSRFRAYLELTRPANVVTAFADILAGFAAATALNLSIRVADGLVVAEGPESLGPQALVALLASTAGLYAGGVVLNDFFDADLDALERPERPIPSGRVPRISAGVFGTALLAIGIASAAYVSLTSLVAAGAIALLVVIYDAWGKHHPLLGPINMGMCRGGNLLLGVSAAPAVLGELWLLSLLPIAYIGAVTAVSRGEVHGGSGATGILAIVLAGSVAAALLLLGIRTGYRTSHALPFVMLFVLLVFPAFLRAATQPSPDVVRRAVKRGVLSLVVMDASLAAGFAGWPTGLAVLALLPISIGLARLFAVT